MDAGLAPALLARWHLASVVAQEHMRRQVRPRRPSQRPGPSSRRAKEVPSGFHQFLVQRQLTAPADFPSSHPTGASVTGKRWAQCVRPRRGGGVQLLGKPSEGQGLAGAGSGWVGGRLRGRRDPRGLPAP